MKPEELVSEGKLKDIAEDAARQVRKGDRPAWLFQQVSDAALFAARAALEELGVARIIEINMETEYRRYGQCLDVMYRHLHDGAVLVRAKDRTA